MINYDDKKTTIKFCLLMVVSFVFYAFFYSQLIPYLEQLGFSKVDRGYILSFGAILGIIFQIIVGGIADRIKKVKLIAVIILIAYLIFIACLYIWNQFFGMGLLFLWASLNSGLYALHTNLIELWAFQSNESVRKRFGMIRLFGSLGWALASFLVGLILSIWSFKVLGYIMLITGFLILLIQLSLADITIIDNNQNFSFSDLLSLLKNKTFIRNLAVCFLLFFAQQADGITVIEKMVELKADSSLIGLKWMICAVVELPLMFFGIKFIIKYGYRKIIGIVCLGFCLRMFLNGIAINPLQMALVASLQFITFPLLLLSQKYMAIDNVDIKAQNSSLMVMTALGTNLPVILIPLIQSLTANILSLSAFCYIISGLALIAFLINQKR